MFRTAARRFAAAVAAVAIVIAVIAATAASADPDPHLTLYHNFCPYTKADVAAAGPYSPSTHSALRSTRP
jgi:hypothetical protein